MINPFNGINPVLMDRLLTWPDIWSCDFRSFFMAAIFNDLDLDIEHSQHAIRYTASLGLRTGSRDADEEISLQEASLEIIDAERAEAHDEESIVRVELLTPSSLPGGRLLQYGEYWEKYRTEREALLQKGDILIELHYIPCGLPVTQGVPIYPNEPNSKAYHATVSAGPTQEYSEGRFWCYSWGIDEPMPVVSFPLVGKDVLCLDLQSAYQRPLSFFKYHLNYNEMPRLWECYRAEDRDKIAARLMTYLTHLDNGTLPTEPKHLPVTIADFNVPGIRNELSAFLQRRRRQQSARQAVSA
ncbi:MAG: hypothetical protein JXB30_04720 [Anaerolineae bacterium]|nr:hypothetical protein [Anaerolineae bacterium]